MTVDHPRGKIVWHELMTTDTRAAISFYGKLVGWGTKPFEHDPSYVMWTSKGVPLGGVMRLPEESRRMGTPPSWLMYVAVPDVDATVRQAGAMGARTYSGPRDLPDGNRFAILADPQGAVFAVFTPKEPQPDVEAPARPGEFSWNELATHDWQAAWRFYEPLFGWVKMDAMDMGPAGIYQMFGRKGNMLGAMYNKPPDIPAPNWLPYARVPSADASAAVAQRLGANVVQGPMEVPGGGRIAVLMDPQGAMFAVHSDTEPEPAKRPAKPKKKAPVKKKTKATATRAPRKKAGKKKKRR